MNKLSKRDLNNVIFRWIIMAVNTYNYQYQQAGSVVFALYPALRKIYKDDNEFQEALQNHFNYFNCMPWLAPLVLGTTLAIEENGGIKDKEMVQNIKTSLMGPLSGVGDTIFWVLVPTIIGSIAGYMALEKNMIGVIGWMCINLLFILMRVKFIHLGFQQGVKLITSFGDKVSLITECASILGLVVVGSLISSVINVKAALILRFGEMTMEIQPMLDKILPSLLPAIITMIIYKLLNTKKVGITLLILLIIIFSMICAYFKILV